MKNTLHEIDMVERFARRLAQANYNLKENVVKTILTANKVQEQVCKGAGSNL